MDARRRKFCINIATGMAKKDAAVEAGYSSRTAGSIASQLLATRVVKAEIKKLTADIDAKAAADDERKLKDRYESSLELLRDVYNNPKLPFSIRVAAAKDALPYEHAKPAPLGRKKGAKEEAQDVADKAGGGKYQTPARPKLKAVA